MAKYEDKTPIPIKKFDEATRGTPEHVYMLYLKRLHGREKHTMKGWHELLESKRALPVKRDF